MVLVDAAGFLELLGRFPGVMPSLHVSFEVSFHIVRHTLSEFADRSHADTIAIDQFFSVELIDE